MSSKVWMAVTPLTTALRYTVITLSSLILIELVYFSVVAGDKAGQLSESLPSVDLLYPEKLAPQTHYDELVQRALFSPDRKPKEPALQTRNTANGKASDNWLLAGVIKSGDESYAMFSEKNGQNRLKLEPGMLLDDWKIETISADQVVLIKNGERDTLPLLVSEPKKKPRKAVRKKPRSPTSIRTNGALNASAIKRQTGEKIKAESIQ